MLATEGAGLIFKGLAAYVLIGAGLGVYYYTKADANDDGVTTSAEFDAMRVDEGIISKAFSPMITVTKQALILANLVTVEEV